MNKLFTIACILVITASSFIADNTPKALTPTIVEVLTENQDCTTLKAVLESAGLLELLESDGPYTVFAPVNAAFDKLPDGLVESLMEPPAKEILVMFLSYHIVEGNYSTADILLGINDNDGSFSITTYEGSKLSASLQDEKIILTDMDGNTSTLIVTDVEASNGMVHAIDSVVKPHK